MGRSGSQKARRALRDQRNTANAPRSRHGPRGAGGAVGLDRAALGLGGGRF